LIFDILLIIFIIVACLLIYSLLLMSVETKTFDIAVMRLLGLTQKGFIGLILVQASFFVIPSVILGFILAFPTIYLLYVMLFPDSISTGSSVIPSVGSIVTALAIGVLIPLISSIIPIRRALSKNLTDALNIQRA
jgi:ABC-type antimicrobial peptide transport system permease subunit